MEAALDELVRDLCLFRKDAELGTATHAEGLANLPVRIGLASTAGSFGSPSPSMSRNGKIGVGDVSCEALPSI